MKSISWDRVFSCFGCLFICVFGATVATAFWLRQIEKNYVPNEWLKETEHGRMLVIPPQK